MHVNRRAVPIIGLFYKFQFNSKNTNLNLLDQKSNIHEFIKSNS